MPLIPGVGKIGGSSFGVPQIPYLARGGLITRGGFAIVGDAGPEMVSLPAGAGVHPLSHTGAAGRPIQANLVVAGRVLASVIIDPLRGEIQHISGGNVQKALGRG